MSVSKNIKANVSHDGDKFRVSYRYLDPVTNQYKNTCKRGFKLKREAKCWIETELPAIIARLEQKKKSIDTMTMEELIELINSLEGDVIICVQLVKEAEDERT